MTPRHPFCREKDMRKRHILTLDLVLVIMVGPAHAATASGSLRVHPTNPRYFADGSGKAVFLTGSHTWANLQDIGLSDPPPAFDCPAYLDFLTHHPHNFVRFWRWEFPEWMERDKKQPFYCAPQPWQRTGPVAALDGKARFDLQKFDEGYFQRLRTRVQTAGERGICVSIMLFEGWGLRFVPDGWKAHPFYPANNVTLREDDVKGVKAIEFFSLAAPNVTALQEAYVRKVIDTVNACLSKGSVCKPESM